MKHSNECRKNKMLTHSHFIPLLVYSNDKKPAVLTKCQ